MAKKLVAPPATNSRFRQQLALYERGQRQLRRHRNLATAAATFAQYRARFPRGALRHEVDLSVIEILIAQGRVAHAEREMTLFLRRYPDSERRAEILRARNIAKQKLAKEKLKVSP